MNTYEFEVPIRIMLDAEDENDAVSQIEETLQEVIIPTHWEEVED